MNLHLVTRPTAGIMLPGEFMGTQAKLDGVDWHQEMALVIDLGEKRTGGYAVEVTGVRETAPGQVEVRVALTEPAPGDFVMQVITHPHKVVTLPKRYLSQGRLDVVVKDQHGQERARQVIQA